MRTLSIRSDHTTVKNSDDIEIEHISTPHQHESAADSTTHTFCAPQPDKLLVNIDTKECIETSIFGDECSSLLFPGAVQEFGSCPWRSHIS